MSKHMFDEKELKKIEHKLGETERKLDKALELLELLVNSMRQVHSFSITGGIMGTSPSGLFSPVTIKPGQSITLTAQPLDVNGNPTVLPSGDVPVWSISDTTNFTATPSADGLSIVLAASATAPTETVNISIADELIPTATGSYTLNVGGASALPVASFSVTSNTPQ